MTLTPEEKQALIKEYAVHEGDTGSPQVQIALLTQRITQLTKHLETYKHDEHSRMGLLKMVGLRRRLLRYLRRTDPDAYQDMIGRLNLRR